MFVPTLDVPFTPCSARTACEVIICIEYPCAIPSSCCGVHFLMMSPSDPMILEDFLRLRRLADCLRRSVPGEHDTHGFELCHRGRQPAHGALQSRLSPPPPRVPSLCPTMWCSLRPRNPRWRVQRARDTLRGHQALRVVCESVS